MYAHENNFDSLVENENTRTCTEAEHGQLQNAPLLLLTHLHNHEMSLIKGVKQTFNPNITLLLDATEMTLLCFLLFTFCRPTNLNGSFLWTGSRPFKSLKK